MTCVSAYYYRYILVTSPQLYIWASKWSKSMESLWRIEGIAGCRREIGAQMSAAAQKPARKCTKT